jgi:hypothetical protein
MADSWCLFDLAIWVLRGQWFSTFKLPRVAGLTEKNASSSVITPLFRPFALFAAAVVASAVVAFLSIALRGLSTPALAYP